MREFSVPAVATITGTTNLTDPVFDNADRFPHTVQFARRDTPGGAWRDVTCAAVPRRGGRRRPRADRRRHPASATGSP